MNAVTDTDSLEMLLATPLLHVLRALSMMWVLPVFGQGGGARWLKIGLAGVLGFSAANATGMTVAVPHEVIPAAILVIREVLFGLLLGFSMSLVFEAVKIAGGLVASEMGLSIASQLDPLTKAQQSPVANLWQSLAMLLFFSGGGHRMILGALVHSFTAVPPGTFAVSEDLALALVDFTSAMMDAAFRMAGPVLLILMVVTACIALLAKVAPALHMLEASYPIRLLAGFGLMYLFLPDLADAFGLFLDDAGMRVMTFAGGAG